MPPQRTTPNFLPVTRKGPEPSHPPAPKGTKIGKSTQSTWGFPTGEWPPRAKDPGRHKAIPGYHNSELSALDLDVQHALLQ